MLICSARLPSLELIDAEGWHGEDVALRMPFIGRAVGRGFAGEDLANLAQCGYCGASLYSVWADHSTLFRSRLELELDSVVAGEIKVWMLGGVCKLC